MLDEKGLEKAIENIRVELGFCAQRIVTARDGYHKEREIKRTAIVTGMLLGMELVGLDSEYSEFVNLYGALDDPIGHFDFDDAKWTREVK